jgi:hypothetical protein
MPFIIVLLFIDWLSHLRLPSLFAWLIEGWRQRYPASVRLLTNQGTMHLSQMHNARQIGLRTGHCHLNAHLFRKLKLAPSPTCFCGLDDQTPEHILLNCPLLKTIRDKTWPTATPLSVKLYYRPSETKPGQQRPLCPSSSMAASRTWHHSSPCLDWPCDRRTRRRSLIDWLTDWLTGLLLQC